MEMKIQWTTATKDVKRVAISAMPEKMVEDLKMLKQDFGARVVDVTFGDDRPEGNESAK